jgi:uncharacterized protein
MKGRPETALYKACLGQGPYAQVSASKAAKYVKSPFGLYCDLFAAYEDRDPPHPYQLHLFTLGQEHEREVIEKDHPEAIADTSATMEGGFRKTLKVMIQGSKAIRGAPLIYRPQGIYGRPDLLEWKEGSQSHFGNYYYEVVEIKYVKKPSRAHLIQGAFYTRLLGFLQGTTPPVFHIENGSRQRLSFKQQDYEKELDEVLAGVRRILAGEIPDPCYGRCGWPWKQYGNRLAIERQDVSLLGGIGPGLQTALKAAGFKTIDDVAAATPKALTRVKGIGQAKADDYHTKARAISSKAPIRRPGFVPQFPKKKYELFLDLEGTDPRFDTEGLSITNYLIGIVSRERGAVSYCPFLAPTPNQEGTILRQFCEYLATLDDYVIYHWHRYDRIALERMFDAHGLPATAKARVLDHLRDLHPIATKAFAFPVYSDGLKPIAGCLGFQWRQEDMDALTAVVLYREYNSTGAKNNGLLKKILVYNEDDCRAVMFVKDWLVGTQNV